MIHNEIKLKIKESMLAKDQVALDTYRGMLSAFTNDLVARSKKPDEILPDDEALVVINRLAKQRKDSIEQFKKGNRDDLVKKEEAELKILETYLPKLMEETEVAEIARKKKEELGITDPTKKGMLMSVLMKDLKGKADGAVVKKVVDTLF